MKVGMIKKKYRHLFSSEEIEQAKAVIEAMKEDSWTPRQYAEMAAREALKYSSDNMERILEADAHVAKNKYIPEDYVADFGGQMDVWIEAIVKTQEGFLEFGAYISDIWQIGAVDIYDRMWMQHYVR